MKDISMNPQVGTAAADLKAPNIAFSGAPFGVLTPNSGHYPSALLTVEGPPQHLYYVGHKEALDQPALAIVGSRQATEYGLGCARVFARRAAERGLAVVSGGAIGCDQAAHQGALDIGVPTIVVLGCGADVIYPGRARALFADIIASGGVLISELPWQTPPLGWAFRRRNRLIAGLGLATLIIEAGLPSGTFSTADATLEQGKDLLAIPGSIFSKQSRGSNRLIAQGAYPVIDTASFDDALASICANADVDLSDLPAAQPTSTGPLSAAGLAGPLSGKPSTASSSLAGSVLQLPKSATALDRAILERLQSEAARPEELLAALARKIAVKGGIVEVLCCLSHLELEGWVKRMRDGRFAFHVQ